jgi:hypothetical protein
MSGDKIDQLTRQELQVLLEVISLEKEDDYSSWMWQTLQSAKQKFQNTLLEMDFDIQQEMSWDEMYEINHE